MNQGQDIPDSLVRNTRLPRANKNKEWVLDLPIGDPGHGETVFTDQCSRCHIPHRNANGPDLSNVWLSTNAHRKDFGYSLAMRTANFYWSREKLFQFILNPQRSLASRRHGPRHHHVFPGPQRPLRRGLPHRVPHHAEESGSRAGLGRLRRNLIIIMFT